MVQVYAGNGKGEVEEEDEEYQGDEPFEDPERALSLRREEEEAEEDEDQFGEFGQPEGLEEVEEDQLEYSDLEGVARHQLHETPSRGNRRQGGVVFSSPLPSSPQELQQHTFHMDDFQDE